MASTVTPACWLAVGLCLSGHLIRLCCSSGFLKCPWACLPFRLQVCETAQCDNSSDDSEVTELAEAGQDKEGKDAGGPQTNRNGHRSERDQPPSGQGDRKAKPVELALTVTHDPWNVSSVLPFPLPPCCLPSSYKVCWNNDCCFLSATHIYRALTVFNVMGTLDDRHIETSERFVPDEDSFPQVSGRAPVGGDEHIRSRGKRAVPLIFTWKSH